MPKYTYVSESGDSVVEQYYLDGKAPSKIIHNGAIHWRMLTTVATAAANAKAEQSAWDKYESKCWSIPPEL